MAAHSSNTHGWNCCRLRRSDIILIYYYIIFILCHLYLVYIYRQVLYTHRDVNMQCNSDFSHVSCRVWRHIFFFMFYLQTSQKMWKVIFPVLASHCVQQLLDNSVKCDIAGSASKTSLRWETCERDWIRSRPHNGSPTVHWAPRDRN